MGLLGICRRAVFITENQKATPSFNLKAGSVEPAANPYETGGRLSRALPLVQKERGDLEFSDQIR